jgi:HlyD family secretion protein
MNMNIALNRLDPNLPDPVESRRRAAGRVVRLVYGTLVFGVVFFFVSYFTKPFVFLAGPGVVSSPRYVLSLPYTVQIIRMDVAPGATVKAGGDIGLVRSPQQDTIVATYMRALADITGRSAELRVRARAAHDSIEAARAYQRVTEEAVEKIEAAGGATVTFRVDVLRERALARKTVASQEAEANEAVAQLAALDAFSRQLHDAMDEVTRSFNGGRITTPITGVISTDLARVGQSLAAGTAITEVLDPSDIFVDWYIPNARLVDPKVGNGVLVAYGNRRITGKIAEILPVSAVYPGTQQLTVRDRQATQIARIRLDPDATAPALNSTVWVRMYYTELAGHLANRLVELLGLD